MATVAAFVCADVSPSHKLQSCGWLIISLNWEITTRVKFLDELYSPNKPSSPMTNCASQSLNSQYKSALKWRRARGRPPLSRHSADALVLACTREVLLFKDAKTHFSP